MLHFPSASKAARVSRPADITKLNELLTDEVWAFSNCRVQAHGRVVELDWLFYNTRLGTVLVSEWKKYPQPVSQVRDEGAPWLLVDGSEQDNPVEQVSAQHEVLRWALREKIFGTFFPGIDAHKARIHQCVYSPDLTPETKKEKLRFGKVFGTLEDMCTAVMTTNSPEPLLVGEMSALVKLAEALGQLFRCKMPPSLADSIIWQHNPRESAHFWERASQIHEQISALHGQLAQLIREEYVPRLNSPPAAAGAVASDDAASVPKEQPVPRPNLYEHVMKRHTSRHLAALNGDRALFIIGMRTYLIALLRDPEIPSDEWISLSGMAAAIREYITDGTDLRELLGTYFWKWCLNTAQESGIDVVVDDVHRNLQVRRASAQQRA